MGHMLGYVFKSFSVQHKWLSVRSILGSPSVEKSSTLSGSCLCTFLQPFSLAENRFQYDLTLSPWRQPNHWCGSRPLGVMRRAAVDHDEWWNRMWSKYRECEIADGGSGWMYWSVGEDVFWLLYRILIPRGLEWELLNWPGFNLMNM